MPIFSPPTYEYSAVDGVPTSHPGHALFRRYTFPRGYSVLITNGTATAHPGTVSPTTDDIAAADTGSGEGGKAAFVGGHVYTITAAERTILEAAGYTVIGDPYVSYLEGY